jgi:hypothetical protein
VTPYPPVGLFGLLPALRSTRVSLTSAMKGSQVIDGERRVRFAARKWIVAGQVALSLVLLVAAGLLLGSFVKLATLDIGFDRNNVLLVSADLKTAKVPPGQRYRTSGRNQLPGAGVRGGGDAVQEARKGSIIYRGGAALRDRDCRCATSSR